MKKPILIGITGGTGSGKTTVAEAIHSAFEGNSITMIMQDSYYKDQSHITFEERLKTNYDHPHSIDMEHLIRDLKSLMSGKSIDMPVYDFAEHTRKSETVHIVPTDIIIVEGILVLDDKNLRDLLDIKIYVDTDADIRILRRMQRDINERGRSMESVINQYLNVVRPMHEQFTEPTKRYADIIIPEGGRNRVAIDVIIRSIKEYLRS
ncbi:uridine kinase [[Eubacterium] yurii subsp. margaretiae ATCC 43715]|nr:uridine kinase [[Eubacterium] yurii subsp. margaretiae ATCC 43715]